MTPTGTLPDRPDQGLALRPPATGAGAGRVAMLLARLDRIGKARFGAAVILLYFLLALVAYLPAWPGEPTRLVGSYIGGDAVQQSWFLLWAPWALLHGHNPLFTSWMDYPQGANLAINTEMPLLGMLAAPLSLTAGSVSSFGLLMYLAYPLSGGATYLVVRRLTGSNVAAACGGLLYGFSAYVVGEGYGHLNLSFVPLPPVIFLALYELLVSQRGRPLLWGLGLGLAVSAQFLISPEILSTTAIMAICGLVILVLARRRSLERERLRYALGGLLPGAAVAIVLLCYPAWFLLAGPLRFRGPVQGITNPFRADLLGSLVPTSAQLVAPSAATSLGDRFTGATFPENGSYLGIPLVLLALWCLVRFRANRWVPFCAGMALVAFVLSLGPQLMVAGHLTGVPLPFDVVGRLPLLQNVLPSRLSLYATFFVVLLCCTCLAELSSRAAAAEPGGSALAAAGAVAPAAGEGGPTATAGSGNRGRVAAAAALVLAAATVVSLLPRWPLTTVPTSTGMPAFFTTAASEQIRVNSVVLTYPFSVSPWNQAMLWQETDKLRFKLVGGYALVPSPGGTASPWPPQLAPLAVQEFLGYEQSGPGNYISPTPIPFTRGLESDLRTYLLRYGVDAVVFDPNYGYKPSSPALVLKLFETVLGPPTSSSGDVDLWLQVPARAAAYRG